MTWSMRLGGDAGRCVRIEQGAVRRADHPDHARGLERQRDREPGRGSVQLYKATSNGVVSESDLDGIARSIGSVYEHADFVGSLVMPEGDSRRPTAWQKVPGEWFPW